MNRVALKALLLRLHRWMFVIFAAPLAVLIFTGFILAWQPIVQTMSVKPGSLTLAQLDAHFAKHDPDNKTRALRINPYDGVLTLNGPGEDGSVDINLKTGAEAGDDADSALSDWFSWARPVHEHLIHAIEWLAPLSTAVMVVGVVIGALMGWPYFRNTVGGWHRGVAWVLLPLLFLSPLTALFMYFRVTFDTPAPRQPGAPLREVVKMIADRHDLSGLLWIRGRGGQTMARVIDGGATHTYIATREGLKPAATNWPRMFHEGVFWGVWGGVMNVVLSLAYATLLGTGLWIWGKRTLRRRRRTARAPQARPVGAE